MLAREKKKKKKDKSRDEMMKNKRDTHFSKSPYRRARKAVVGSVTTRKAATHAKTIGTLSDSSEDIFIVVGFSGVSVSFVVFFKNKNEI